MMIQKEMVLNELIGSGYFSQYPQEVVRNQLIDVSIILEVEDFSEGCYREDTKLHFSCTEKI